jgi:hypothetical protein
MWPTLKLSISKLKIKVKVTKSKCLYSWKGIVVRNTHVKYESPSIYHSKEIAKVKVLNK